MKKILTALLLALCLLPMGTFAEGSTEAGQIEFIYPPVIKDGATIYYIKGDLVLDRQEYRDYEQTVYRPITYVKHYSNGEVETTMEPVAMLTVSYRYYYGINKEGQYVYAGGNPEPGIEVIAPEQFEVSAEHVADTACNAVQLPDFAGYTYTFRGGYLTMDYYDVIHLDENDNIIRKELNYGQLLVYSCTFTYPEQ